MGNGLTVTQLFQEPDAWKASGPGPQLGCLYIDQTSKIIRPSSGLMAALGLPDDARIDGTTDLLNLLEERLCPDSGDLRKLRRVIDPCEAATQEGIPHSIALRKAPSIPNIKVEFTSLTDLCSIVSFGKREPSSLRTQIAASDLLKDPLTGIGNRTLLEQKLDHALVQLATRELSSVTICFLDLDRFKMVNDTLGHAVGDTLLRIVGERLKSVTREGDNLARLGGDEFAILLRPDTDREATSLLAAQLTELIQRPYLIDGHVINVGSSMGIALAPEDGTSRQDLLKSADLALYHSKAAGRGVFHFFHSSMEERAQQRRVLELELRKALPLRQFELHYQPQIDAESRQVIGLEGLLRWRHPVRGLLTSGAFMSLAEEIGAAGPIGSWVLKTACKEAMRWPPHIKIAVNVSPFQFEAIQFRASVEQALASAGLTGERLEIEVTEDILLRDGAVVLNTLDALRALGVRVTMDNFGTGLASLSQLVNFPFDKIKIDRSLVCCEQSNTKNRAIVRAISALGQSLGISTLAEGIETAEHLAAVRLEGCHGVQGFFNTDAVPSSELITLFASLNN